jgi:hypothetical protein
MWKVTTEKYSDTAREKATEKKPSVGDLGGASAGGGAWILKSSNASNAEDKSVSDTRVATRPVELKEVAYR